MDFYFTLARDSDLHENFLFLKNHLVLRSNYEVALVDLNIRPAMYSIGYVSLHSYEEGQRKYETRFRCYAFENELMFKIIERLDTDISNYFISKAIKQGNLFNEKDKKSFENFELDLTVPLTLGFQKNLDKKYEMVINGDLLLKVFKHSRLSTEKSYPLADPFITHFKYCDVYYIRLNIIEFQCINNERQQFLRQIDASQQHHTFPDRIYLPVNKTEVYSLSLSICDSNGDALRFKQLKFSATLHFKQRK